MFTLYTLILLRILIKFQFRRRRNQTLPPTTYPIRNILFEWEHRRSIQVDPQHVTNDTSLHFNYASSLLCYIDMMTCYNISITINDMRLAYLERYHALDEPFNLRETYYDDPPQSRIPAQNIEILPFRYHSIPPGMLNIDDVNQNITNDSAFTETPDERSHYVYSDDATQPDLTGFPPHPEIAKIIHDWFPVYEQYLSEYCRPPSFGPQAFADFNRATETKPRLDRTRHDLVMMILRLKLNIKPYRPLHFVDALAAETPLNTSASYYSKSDIDSRIFARYSSPMRYNSKGTSKGFHFNVTMNTFRHTIHNIKYFGTPHEPLDPYDDELNHALTMSYFHDHPTQLFIRTQISKRDPSLSKKIRPVYSVDERFLHIGKMLLTNCLAQCRNAQCAIAHGLETFRGSMSFLNRVFMYFSFFISLDWSQFDQRLPLYVILAFYLDFVPSLLIVSHGYFPSFGYVDTSSTDSFAEKIFNILFFYIQWYLNMVFLSYDGFSFVRLFGGVPSGLLETQLLDSFGNLYIILDCLLEFGFTPAECLMMLFFVMGDDNLIMTMIGPSRMYLFLAFLDNYVANRHGMIVSILKTVASNLRSRLTFLSYENSEGIPTRPIGKLVAQLAFPERPVPKHKEWLHAARALGLAYASCGQDATFHLLCKFVYDKFRPSSPVPANDVRKIFSKWLHQLDLFHIDETQAYYTFEEFPTYHAIRASCAEYQGPFSENDKWNFNLFPNPPSDNISEYVTLKEWINSRPALLRKISQTFDWYDTL
uniref:RNA-dependent RNA polymerase n=1 Tax=Ceratobasidium partitivirus TaxID=1905681 RepID=A0A219WGI7_9VIRU|nr:RNA-dependent RNA polymerase [Ceratobasidium partitivirus]